MSQGHYDKIMAKTVKDLSKHLENNLCKRKDEIEI